ncbi:hypothetical protein I3W98_37505 [Streptomyces cavourensis]|nr:hypothetical protein [Streptomyces cavourensis]
MAGAFWTGVGAAGEVLGDFVTTRCSGVGAGGAVGPVAAVSIARRWSTGMAAASCPAGAAGALCPCPVGAAGMAPEGISRRGLPRAGRTASGAAPAGAEGAAAAAGAAGVEEAVGVAGVVAGAAGVVGATPVICRSRIAGRRATISGGAVRRGRTAAGRARCTEAEAEAEAGTGSAAEEALVSGPAASAPSRAAGAAEAVGAAGAAPPPAFATFAARCTGGVAFGRTVRTVFAAGRVEIFEDQVPGALLLR